MLKNSNPGLARRMRLESAFRFEDFDDAALVRILRAKAQGAGLSVDAATARHAVAVLAKARAEPNFGNAGAVDNLLSSAKLELQARLQRLPPAQRAAAEDVLLPEDFGEDPRAAGARGGQEEIFAGLVGLESVMAKLREYSAVLALASAMGDDPRDRVNFNFLFVGSPGTGKTTVARRMGKLFKSYGLLPFDDVIEVSASDLTTGYAGQAGKMTKARPAIGPSPVMGPSQSPLTALGGLRSDESLNSVPSSAISPAKVFNPCKVVSYCRPMPPFPLFLSPCCAFFAQETLQKAKGRVLFIDEAYQLVRRRESR